MLVEPNEIQKIHGKEVMPWYTFSCLDHLLSLDYRNWEVFEWGGGCSTVWYSINCHHVDCLETDEVWAQRVKTYLDSKSRDNYTIEVISVPPSANTPHPHQELYLNYLTTMGKLYDVVVIDGSYRNDCIPISLSYIKPGGLLIFDNFEQDTSGYEILPNKSLLDRFPCKIFTQPDRTYWKTGVWEITDV